MTTMEIILVTLVAAICGMGSVLDERQTHRLQWPRQVKY